MGASVGGRGRGRKPLDLRRRVDFRPSRRGGVLAVQGGATVRLRSRGIRRGGAAQGGPLRPPAPQAAETAGQGGPRQQGRGFCGGRIRGMVRHAAPRAAGRPRGRGGPAAGAGALACPAPLSRRTSSAAEAREATPGDIMARISLTWIWATFGAAGREALGAAVREILGELDELRLVTPRRGRRRRIGTRVFLLHASRKRRELWHGGGGG